MQQLTKVQREFIDTLSFFRTKTKASENSGVVLVQMVKDYEYTVKLAAASKVFADENNLSVSLYEVDINWIWERELQIVYYETLFKSSLEKIHLAFNDEVIFRNSEKYNDQKFIKTKLNKIVFELKRKETSNLLNLKFDNILVGDLIYDTYLRFFHKPTVEVIDKDVIHTIEVALNVFYNFNSLLKSTKVKCLLNTYSSYIHHGIPARICLEREIDVYTLGSHSYILQKLNKDFPYHSVNHVLFSADKKLSEEQLESAKEKLTSRFAGKIDVAISYMRQSAYAQNTIGSEFKKQLEQHPRNIIIFAHDFYDSPHVNRQLQFSDLYQWLRETLNALTDLQDTSVFIKPHPNGIKGCKEQAIELVESFGKGHFIILDESVSNLNIVELQPDLIVTARGTVGVEMAWFEIPVVALFDNLYANFNFVHTCHTREEYFAIIRGERAPKIDFDKKKICSFYYQAFLEKVPHHIDIFNLLKSFKGDSFNDRYLEFMLSNGYLESREILIEHYSSAFDSQCRD